MIIFRRAFLWFPFRHRWPGTAGRRPDRDGARPLIWFLINRSSPSTDGARSFDTPLHHSSIMMFLLYFFYFFLPEKKGCEIDWPRPRDKVLKAPMTAGAHAIPSGPRMKAPDLLPGKQLFSRFGALFCLTSRRVVASAPCTTSRARYAFICLVSARTTC